jgi:tetratricopeptide (TPR) repeat protein
MPRKIKQYTNPFLKAKGTLATPTSQTLPDLEKAAALHQQGQFGQAEAIYRQILNIEPKNVQTLHLMGLLAFQTGHHKNAVDIISQAIEINPNVASYYSIQGIALQILKEFDASVVNYDKAIALKPDYTEAYYNRGVALQELKQLDAAVASYDKAIAFKPDYAEAYLNRGIALQEFKNFDAAIASYEKAIALKPDYAEAYSNLGNALQELEQFGAAIASFDKAIALKPDYAEAYYNRGNALQEIKQFDAAITCYEKAIVLKPDYAEAYYNRGINLQEIKQFDYAIASYNKAIALKPDYAEAYYNRGLLKLVRRDFYNGFLDCKHRWDSNDFPSEPQRTKIPSALRSGIKGRLLIWAEQGIGDEIFYAGLLPMLSTKDVSIALTADKRLHPIYRSAFPKIELLDKNILMSSSADTGFDAQAPIGDLGFLLDIKAATIKETRSPYLQSDPVKRDSYRRTISALGPGLACGVAWKSGNAKLGAAKSIGLDSFAPLLGLTGVNFVNLQYGDVKEEIQRLKSTLAVDIHQVPGVDVFNDIESLLALIDACDVIVTTSNVTAHLAGSIGKRAAVLVPHSKGKFWYWHENDEYSFWYPSLKLFYQDNALTWDKTIEDCSDWIKRLL